MREVFEYCGDALLSEIGVNQIDVPKNNTLSIDQLSPGKLNKASNESHGGNLGAFSMCGCGSWRQSRIASAVEQSERELNDTVDNFNIKTAEKLDTPPGIPFSSALSKRQQFSRKIGQPNF